MSNKPDPEQGVDESEVNRQLRNRRGTDLEELEGRIVRSPGGAEFVARIRRLGNRQEES
jgi:hypothetical protein